VGHSVIPRDVACCETTINLPPVSAAAAAKGDFCESVFVVDDLTKHPDLCERPYVTGYPSSRYYAGVPITTRSGANIGAYCILDDKPRQGISQRDLVFMHDMSQTVMTHLETVRALSDCRQNNQMVAGLGEFIRGPSNRKHEPPPVSSVCLDDNVDKSTKSVKIQPIIPDALIDVIVSPGIGSSHSVRKEYFDNKTVSDQLSLASDPSSFGSLASQHGHPSQSEPTPKAHLHSSRDDVQPEGQDQAIIPDTSMPAETSTRGEAVRPSLADGISTWNRGGSVPILTHRWSRFPRYFCQYVWRTGRVYRN
jgi:hypothetical protein